MVFLTRKLQVKTLYIRHQSLLNFLIRLINLLVFPLRLGVPGPSPLLLEDLDFDYKYFSFQAEMGAFRH
jgi:hypothetical protein